MLPSILHSTHEAKAKLDLENGSGERLCCLYFLRKDVAAMVVLIGVLDTVDPDKLLVCLSIGTESLAAALDTRCRPAALWQPEVSQDTSAHF